MSAGADVRRLKVRSGVEVTDGRPIGVVYLVDRPGPLVEFTYVLPVCEAVQLAARIMIGYQRGEDPVRVRAHDRDLSLLELELPSSHAQSAFWTIGRFAEQARLRAAQPPGSV